MTLNARIETLDEKPSFKYSIDKRCLVIANKDFFAFAGIYSQWGLMKNQEK